MSKLTERLLSSVDKGENPKFDNSLSAWLDRLLMRGQYASVGVAKEFLEGETDPNEYRKAAWRGLTGQTKGSYRGLAEDYDLPAPFWTGLVGDIALDPLTYIPFGKIAGTVTKPLSKLPLVQKAGKAVYASKPIQTLGKAMIPNFRPAGVTSEVWDKLVKAKTIAKNLENFKTGEAVEFATKIGKDIKDLMKKGTIGEGDLGKIITSVERGYNKFNLPKEVQPIFGKLTTFWDDIAKRRGTLGKSLLKDDELNYFLHQLPKAELEKVQKLGLDGAFREYSTKTSSDITRQYKKFLDFDDPLKSFVGKPEDLKLVPFKVKGISKEHLGEMFESTIRDISDLEDVAKIYGITLKYTPKARTLGKAVGSWKQKGRIFTIATGGQSQGEWISSVAHELAHVIDAEIGAYTKLAMPSVKSSIKKAIPKSVWSKLSDKITLLGDDVKTKIWKAMEYSDDFIKSEAEYLNEPTEIFARFIQVMKKNPLQAKEISPELYTLVTRMFDGGGLDKLARNIFLSPQEFGKQIPVEGLYKQLKTGKLFVSKGADWMEKSKVLPAGLSDDIPNLVFTGEKRMGKAEAGTAFMNSVKELGSDIKLKGWVKSSSPELKGKYFNPLVAKEIDKTRVLFTGEESTKEMLRWFDAVQNGWKRWTLGVFPAYHFRNIIGNVWNNYLAGVSNPKYYSKAIKLQRKIGRGVKLTPKEELIWNYAKKNGVVGLGRYGADIPSLVEPSLAKKTSELLNAPALKGMEIGGHIEDNARLAHFIGQLDRGLKPDEAVFSVKKYLFDYSELTDFESNVMRRIMPFYTWTRKNIPLQFEALWNQTGKVLPIEKARRSAYQGVGSPDEAYLEDWVKERMPFFYGQKDKEYSYFPVESWLPYGDIAKAVRPTDILGELLSPIFKVPIEIAANKSFYFNTPIESYKGETAEFLRNDMPVRMAYILRQFRLLNEAHRIAGYKETVGSTAPPQPSIAQRLTRFGTGIKSYKYDIDKSKRSIKWNLEKELKAFKVGLTRSIKYGRKKEASRILTQISKMESEIRKMK